MMLPHSDASASLRIIVADDQEWIRLILVQVVRQTLPAATIIETENGLQAFDAYQHGGCNFLISNHTMPGMDGMGLISNVRRRSPNLPIVMVSVHPEAKFEAEEAGAGNGD